MRRSRPYVLLSYVLFASVLAAQEHRAVQPLAITQVTVVDVRDGALHRNQTVIIRGNRISAVGPTNPTVVPDGARVIDARGRYLIPGLWDMHVHIPGEAETRTVYFPLNIANGITGVRVMWGRPFHLTAKEDVESGTVLGPRMVVGTPILDGRMWPGSVSVASPEDARRSVASLASQGYDFIKTYQFLRRDVYFAIADEAKRRRVPFVGHVPLTVSASEAADAGQRSFEHNIGLTLACSRDEARIRPALVADEAKLPPESLPEHHVILVRAEMDPLPTVDADKCSALASSLRKNGTWLVPTLVLYRGLGAMPDSPLRKDPRLKYIPGAMRTRFANTPPTPALNVLRPHVARLAATMQRAGVGVLAGTDTPNPYVLPGFSLHDELMLLVEAGFTPLQALQAATLNPARFLDMADSLGSIEPGKVADLVLLDANPFDDIRHTQKIRAVVVGGRFVDREELDTLLEQVDANSKR